MARWNHASRWCTLSGAAQDEEGAGQAFYALQKHSVGFFVIDQEKNSQGELAVVKKIWPFKSFFSSKLAHECTWNTKVMNIMPWKGIRPWFPVLDGWWCHGGEMERQCCHLNRSVLFFYFFKAKIEDNSPAPSVWGRQRLIRAFIRAVKAMGGCEAFTTLNLSGRRDD